jgi:hypothetical protein
MMDGVVVGGIITTLLTGDGFSPGTMARPPFTYGVSVGVKGVGLAVSNPLLNVGVMVGVGVSVSRM